MTTVPSRMLMLGALALTLGAAAGPSTAHAQAARSGMSHQGMSHEGMSHGGWQPMDEFHMLLMKAWHPVSESRDFAPARANAAAMKVSAEAWTKAEAPASCGGDAVKGVVNAIAADARTVAALVERKATDAELEKALSALHDRFEGVEKRCAAPATPPGPR